MPSDRPAITFRPTPKLFELLNAMAVKEHRSTAMTVVWLLERALRDELWEATKPVPQE
jgi:hypothetical protein